MSLMVLFALLSGLSQAAAGPLIASVNTDQARYAPRSAVKIFVNLTNITGSAITGGSVTLYCKHLDTTVWSEPLR